MSAPGRAAALEPQCLVTRRQENLGRHGTQSGITVQGEGERRQPPWLDHDVRVHERDVVTATQLPQTDVAARPEAAVLALHEHPNTQMGLADPLGHAVVGGVVDQDDLEAVVRPLGGHERIETAPRELAAVVVDDNDPNARGRAHL